MRKKTIVVIILITFIPTCILATLANHCMLKTMKTYQENALEDMASIVVMVVSQFYNEQYHAIQAEVEDGTYQSFFHAYDADPQEAERLRPETRRILGDSCLALGNGVLIDLDGKVILAADPNDEGLMLDRTELYRTIMQNEEDYINTIILENNDRKIEIALPVNDEAGAIIGIVRHWIDLTYLQKYVETIRLGQGGSVHLLSKKGAELSIWNNSTGLRDAYDEFESVGELHQLLEHFYQGKLESEKGVITYRHNGQETVGAFIQESGTGWLIVATMDFEKINQVSGGVKHCILAVGFFLTLLGVLAGAFVSAKLTKPLVELNKALKSMAAGDLTVRCTTESRDEFHEISENVNALVSQLQKSKRDLRMSARIDLLTLIPNRCAIDEALDTLLYKDERQAIMMLDVGGLKEINGSFGHEMGDRILSEVGDVLKLLPKSNCYPSRLGGDEFLIFLNGWDDEHCPEVMAKQLISQIENIRFIDDVMVHVNASIGIAYRPEERRDKKVLIKRSRMAMEKAKKMGKGTYVIFSQIRKEEE